MVGRPIDKAKRAIKDAAKEVQVAKFTDPHEYLGAVYNAVKAELGAYSYLKFAEDLGFGKINMLRLIIIGERPLTIKTALRLADGFDLHGNERRYFTAMVDYTHSKNSNEREALFRNLIECKSRLTPGVLDNKQVRYFSEWFYPVLREMTAIKGFKLDPEWLRSRLRFPLHISDVKRGLELMVELGYVTYNANTDTYRRSNSRIHTPFEVDSLAVVSYHQKMIEVARESITRVKQDEREVTALTVCMPKNRVAEMKTKIQALMDEMEGMESDAGQVYQLNIQLFPFTKE